MGKKNPDARRFASSERSPLQDVTNSPLNANAESSSAARQKSSQSWYARLSDEKKAELLEKRRVARHEKKAAAVQSVSHPRGSEEHASSVGSQQCVPLSNITSTHIDVAVCTAASSAGTAHQCVPLGNASSVGSQQCVPLSNITNTHIDVAVCTAASSAGTAHLHQDNIAGRKRSPQSWYAGLSDERRAEYIHKQKMARLARKAATAGVNVQVPTSSASQASSGHTSTPANYGGREHQLQEIVGQFSKQYGNEDGSAQSEITRVHATPTGRSNLEVDGSDDWLHSNPTYIRRAMSAKHVQDSSVPTGFISGRSIEPLDASHEKDRLRKKKIFRNEYASERVLAVSESCVQDGETKSTM